MNAVKHISEKKRFSLIARSQSFKYAFRGVAVIVRTQHNFWIHIVATVIAVGLGVWLGISSVEWCVLILAMVGVLVTEAINTAFEIDIDLTSPEYHPYAKDTKDVAAGAVLLCAIAAVLVGGIIFIPKLLFLI
ncbi:diacylglycerol kinase family protein [Patescibacteria group bacterium]|nr:diacylglycerol kinase family protein [Patescibacteria group bacterium]